LLRVVGSSGIQRRRTATLRKTPTHHFVRTPPLFIASGQRRRPSLVILRTSTPWWKPFLFQVVPIWSFSSEFGRYCVLPVKRKKIGAVPAFLLWVWPLLCTSFLIGSAILFSSFSFFFFTFARVLKNALTRNATVLSVKKPESKNVIIMNSVRERNTVVVNEGVEKP